MPRNIDLRAWAGWIVIVLAAFLYLATLDTGLRPEELNGGDLITHQYAQVQARPSNAPGYPLYTMGGWLWFRLTRLVLGQVLNPVQRLASYSTLWALLSLFLLYRLTLRATEGNWVIAALSTAFYATTYFFWFYSVTTEQYTSAVFQTLLIVWLAFKWEEAETEGQPSNHYLLLLAFTLGTCLANLVTTLFVLPPLLWLILNRRPQLLRQPRLIALSAGLALLPLISYAFVYARGAAHPEWRGEGEWPSAGAWFLDFLTTQQGRDELAPGLTLSSLFTTEFPALIWGELTWLVLVGGVIGLWWLGRRRAIFIATTLAIYLLFCWVDRFGNWFQVIIPAYPLFVLGFATGLNALWSKEWQAEGWRLAARSLIVLGLVVLTSYRLVTSLPRADQSHRLEDTGLEPGWMVLADQPPANSIILAEHNEWLALQYLAQIWNASPLIHPRPLCESDPSALTENAGDLVSTSAVYLTRRAAAVDPNCLSDQHRYAAGANLIKVQTYPNIQLPSSAQPANINFETELTLAGFEVWSSPDIELEREARWLPPANPPIDWRISLYWQASHPLEVDYTVSVRPLLDGKLIPGEDGKPLIQDHQPVWNSYPTNKWSPGEIVRDDYVLAIPNHINPNGAQVIVYRSTSEGIEDLGEAELVLSTDPVQ